MTESDTRGRLYVAGRPPAALPATGSASGAQRWWETDYGAWRRNAEREAMTTRFPAFHLCETVDGALSWMGPLRSTFDPERRYLVRVAYPPTFPDSAPEVVIESPGLPEGTPHVLGPQRPCLFHPAQGARHGYDPGKTTAATLVAWTALWIHACETWQATGTWPGRAH